MTLDTGQPQRSIRSWRRRLWLFAPLFFVLLVAVTSGAIWHWRLSLVEWALPGAVRNAGIELVAVSVDHLDFGGVELSDLRFGPSSSQRIAGASITWSVSELLDRKLRRIEIFGADLHAVVGPDGTLVLEGLLLPRRADRPSSEFTFLKNLPFERVGIEASRVAVTLPDGQADVVVKGHLEVSADGLVGEISARYLAETQRGSGAGTGNASVTWTEDSAPRVEFNLEFDRLVTANATGTNLRLSGSTDGVTARLEDMSFRAKAFAEAIEVPQLAVRDLDLSVELSGGALDVRGEGEILDWMVALSTRLHPFDLSVPASVVVSARGDANSVLERVARVVAEGDVAIAIDAEVGNPAELFAARDELFRDPSLLAKHVAARLDLELALQRLALSDMFATGAVTAKVLAHWSEGVLNLDFGDRSHFDGMTLAPNLDKQLAAWVLGASSFDVTLTEGMSSPPAVEVSWPDGRLNFRAVGGVEVAFPDGKVEMEVDGSASATPSGGIERFNITALRAVLAAVPTKYGSATGDVLVTDLSGEGETLAGVAGGEISVSGVSARPFSARQLMMKFDGEFGVTADQVSVALSPGSWVTARDGRLTGDYSIPGTTRLQVAGGRHRLALDRHSGEISADIRFKPGDAKLHLAPHAVGIAHGPVAVVGTWPGRMMIDAKDVSAGLDNERSARFADLRFRAEGKSSHAVVAIMATGVEPVLPGLTLPSLDATGKVVRDGSSLDGELEIIASGGQPSLRVRGQYNIETGTGAGEILEARLRFAPGVMQPGDINPALSGTIENVFATISLEGPIAWDRDGTLAPNLTLRIDDIAATTDNFELFDANTTILLTGVPDLETPPGQIFSGQVRVGRLDPVPLDVSFQFLPSRSGASPRLIIEKLAAQLSEGRLTTDQFTLTPPSIDTDVTLRLEGVDLAPAFNLIGVAGFGGTGQIGGEIPLVVRGNQVAISGGRLVNDGPGEVFYNTAFLPPTLIERGDTISLVLRALSKFTYDEMQVEMNKALDGPGSLRVRLAGANPTVLEGHPFVFNINLESNFDQLATLVLEGLNTSQGLLRALALSAGSGTGAVVSP